MVLFTAVAYVAHRQAASIASAKAAFPAQEYLAMRLETDLEDVAEAASTVDASFRQRYAATVRELKRRVAAESRIAGVTLAEQLPLMPQGGGRIELDAAGPAETASRGEASVATAAVDLDFFEVFSTPILAGRAFAPNDTAEGANTVVVNHLFVERILGGRSAIGRRIRYKLDDSPAVTDRGPWYEIVGVVRDLVPDPDAPLSLDNPAKPVVYHTLGSRRAKGYPLYLATHVKGDPSAVLPTLRLIAAEVSPTLRLHDVQRLDRATGTDARAWSGFANVIVLVSGIALVLSMAAIYSVTSFAVSRRTREIAVRMALGAPTSSVVANVFRRPLAQVAIGVAVGTLMVGLPVMLSVRHLDAGTVARQAALVVGYGTMMVAVCALACIGPLLRVFRVSRRMS
jgi:hypothetical protein